MASKVRLSFFPSWLLFSLFTLIVWGAWGLESKIVVDRISPWMNQVLFPIGLLPLIAWSARSRGLRTITGSATKGAAYGLLTGLLGGIGNVAFYVALSRGGQASVVTPLVGLAPLVTVVLALVFLHEKLNGYQVVGLLLALVSIYFLST
jgi:bacterial/archaeal transporter family protein